MAQAACRLRRRTVGRHLLAGRARRQPGGPGHAQPASRACRSAGALERWPGHRPRSLRPGHDHRRRPGRRPRGSRTRTTTSWWAVARLVREKGCPALRCHGPARGRHPRLRVAAIGPDRPTRRTLAEADRRTAATSASGSSAPVTTSRGSMPAWTSSCSRRVGGLPTDADGGGCHGGAGGGHRHRGCRQVVDDGTTGLLVPVGDPVALAAAIERLAMDPAERRRLGTAASQGPGLLRPRALHRHDAGHVRTLLVRAGLAAPGKTAAA